MSANPSYDPELPDSPQQIWALEMSTRSASGIVINLHHASFASSLVAAKDIISVIDPERSGAQVTSLIIAKVLGILKEDTFKAKKDAGHQAMFSPTESRLLANQIPLVSPSCEEAAWTPNGGDCRKSERVR